MKRVPGKHSNYLSYQSYGR